MKRALVEQGITENTRVAILSGLTLKLSRTAFLYLLVFVRREQTRASMTFPESQRADINNG